MIPERLSVMHSWCIQADWNAPTIVGGEGAWFWDADGHRYLDMSSLAECMSLGHQHPALVRAIREQAEKLCDSVCIIAKGSKVLDGRLAEIKREHGGRTVTIAVDGGVDALHAILEDGSLVAKADRYPQYAEVELVAGASPQTLLEAIVRQRLQVRRFEAGEASLHKIFVDLVGKDAATPRAEEDRHHA